jgi:hypothetical protein
MYRRIRILLAFYVMAISCFPCQDEIVISLQNKVKTEVATASGHASDCKPDLCSPFCICACCAGTTMLSPLLKLPRIRFNESGPDVVFLYKSFLAGGELATIWQPPKA